jgi:hypothetical protein
MLGSTALIAGAHEGPDYTPYLNPRAGVAASLPLGWHPIYRPINGVVYPPQVLAAATFHARVPHSPKGCHPSQVLRQMPDNGVLLQIFEYAARDSAGKPVRVPELPPRPGQFRYRNGTYARFECFGLSHKFEFEQGGRAFQAHVWFDPQMGEPMWRAQALKILESFHLLKGTANSSH